MNGINILNKTAIMEYTFEANVFFAVLVIVWFISAIAFIIGLIGSFKWPAIIGGFFLIISFITLEAANLEKTEHTGQYKYEATIDDNVPFIEVYKKYDIVKQKGDLWVLKDKEKNKK